MRCATTSFVCQPTDRKIPSSPTSTSDPPTIPPSVYEKKREKRVDGDTRTNAHDISRAVVSLSRFHTYIYVCVAEPIELNADASIPPPPQRYWLQDFFVCEYGTWSTNGPVIYAQIRNCCTRSIYLSTATTTTTLKALIVSLFELSKQHRHTHNKMVMFTAWLDTRKKGRKKRIEINERESWS